MEFQYPSATIQGKSKPDLNITFSWSSCGCPYWSHEVLSLAFGTAPFPKPLREVLPHCYVIGLGKPKPVFLSGQILSNPGHTTSLSPEQSFQFFLLCSELCDHPCIKKRYLEKSLHIVKKHYFPSEKGPHGNSSAGVAQDYLSGTKVM